MPISQFYSILVAPTVECLVTSEYICDLPTKPLKESRMKKANKNLNILENSSFKKIVFLTMIISTIIINLGYICPRESSKVD